MNLRESAILLLNRLQWSKSPVSLQGMLRGQHFRTIGVVEDVTEREFSVVSPDRQTSFVVSIDDEHEVKYVEPSGAPTLETPRRTSSVFMGSAIRIAPRLGDGDTLSVIELMP